jgi:hypothetical protein
MGIVSDVLGASSWYDVLDIVHHRRIELFDDSTRTEFEAAAREWGRSDSGFDAMQFFLRILQVGAAGGPQALLPMLNTFGELPKMTLSTLTSLRDVVDATTAKRFADSNRAIVPHLLLHVLQGNAFWQLLFTSASRMTEPIKGQARVAKTNLAIRASSERRIFKVLPLSEGGFAVTAPYHAARSGMLMKMERDYSITGERDVDNNDVTPFTASDRVKLSYHADGFVQFSGENSSRIISGRDSSTGEPRGLGIVTRPLAVPVQSGPSVTCAIWGIDAFELWRTRSDEYNVFFAETEFYDEPEGDSDPSKSTPGFVISIFVFPRQSLEAAIGPVRSEDEIVMKLPMNVYLRKADFIVKLVCVSAHTVLGLIAKKRTMGFGEATSGFELSSPSDARGVGMHAIYPQMPWSDPRATSLDRSE